MANYRIQRESLNLIIKTSANNNKQEAQKQKQCTFVNLREAIYLQHLYVQDCKILFSFMIMRDIK